MYKLLLPLLTMMLLACSGGSDVAGGSDMPNGIITGVVIASDGANASSASVELSGVKLSHQGDSTFWKQSTQTNTDGEYTFTNVPENDYILKATLKSGETAILSHVTKNADKLVINPLSTSNSIVIKGRLLESVYATHVFIPGTGISAPIQSDSTYTLNDVPRGELALTFSNDSVMNVLPIQVDATADRDTFFVRDAYFLTNGSISYNYHSTPNAFFTYVELYNKKAQPNWYIGRNFSGITYFDHIDNRELWYFPIEVLITSITENNYSYIMDQIKQQILNANSIFRDSRFNGKILFAVEHNYTLNSTTPPPFDSDRFSMRVIYDESGSYSSVSEWKNSERTFILNGNDFVNNGLFSHEAQIKLTQGLALSRGCENLFEYDVTADENSVNAFSYRRDELLLWGTGGSEWDVQSIELINRNKSQFKATETFSAADYPEAILLKVSQNGQPVAGAEVFIYGFIPSMDSTNISPRYDYHTDDQGYYRFTENPFLEGDYHSQYNSFLAKVVHNNSEVNRWIPAFELRGEYYNTASERVVIDINL